VSLEKRFPRGGLALRVTPEMQAKIANANSPSKKHRHRPFFFGERARLARGVSGEAQQKTRLRNRNPPFPEKLPKLRGM
jgi:hypothetical protein